MLDHNTLKQLSKDRESGLSIKEIARLYSVSTSTVSKYVKNINLSKDAKKILETKQALGKIKGNVSRRKVIEINDTDKYVLLLAHTLFDGGVYADNITYFSSHSTLINRFSSLGRVVFSLKPHIYLRSNGVNRVTFYSLQLVERITNDLQNIRSFIDTEERKRSFLKCFFDDEGSVTYTKNTSRRVVRGYQRNKSLIFYIKSLLSELGIESKIYRSRQVFELVIYGRRNLLLFYNLINFSRGVTFLAKRSNSIHKRPIEKRSILRAAIESYTTTSL